MPTNTERIDELEKTTKDLQVAVGEVAASVDNLESTMAEQFAVVLAKLDSVASQHTDPLAEQSNFDGIDPLAWLA